VTESARPTKASDASALVRRCLEGNPGAERELFRNHKRGVHAALFRILGSNRDIEDLIQDTFIQVFRSLQTFRGDASLSTWIGRITTRVAFAYIRKRKATRELEAQIESDDHDRETPLEALETKRAVAALYSVLDRLDPKHRIAYAFAVIDGRPLAEVASLMEASVTATKSRVWRARREVNRRSSRDPRLARYLSAQEQM